MVFDVAKAAAKAALRDARAAPTKPQRTVMDVDELAEARYFIFFYTFTGGSKVGIGHGWAGLSWVGMPPAKRAKALIAKSNNLDPGGLVITGFQELSLEDFQAFTLDD